MELYEFSQLFSRVVTNNYNNKAIECSNNKTKWKHKHFDEALTYAWIAVNTKVAKSIIVVDIDPAQYNKERIEATIAKIPPNAIVSNEHKEGSIQLFYILSTPILDPNYFNDNLRETISNYSFQKYEKKLNQFEYLKSKLYSIFQSDLNMKNYKAKNPLCAYWQCKIVSNRLYTLNYLNTLLNEFESNKEINITHCKERGENKNYVHSKNSTNCNNFDHLRKIGYEWIKTYKDSIEDKNELSKKFFDFLRGQANPAIYGHQTKSEIDATVRSIVKFCVEKYQGNSAHSKINDYKREIKMEKIQRLKNLLGSDLNKRMTKDQIKELSIRLEVSEKTVKNYITEARKESKIGLKTDKEIIIFLRDNEGLKFDEIAQKLKKNINTVKQTYYRNKEKAQSNLCQFDFVNEF